MKERKLKKELRLAGYDVSDIAKECDVTKHTIYNYIKGKTPIPGKVVRVFKQLGVSGDAIANPSEFV